jgi:hypothetical protein
MILKNLMVLVLLGSLVGCSSVGSYRSLADGNYLVVVHSNKHSNEQEVKAKAVQESTQACDGRYHVVERLPVETRDVVSDDEYNFTDTISVTQKIIGCGPASNEA